MILNKVDIEDELNTIDEKPTVKHVKHVSKSTTLLDPKLIERQLKWVEPGKCDRTGMCCIRVPIPISPRKLRESYESWKHIYMNKIEVISSLTMGMYEHPTFQQRVYSDINLIYPMLVGRCLGKTKNPFKKHEKDTVDFNKEYFYIYGPCKNFQFDKSGLATCTIQDHKPWMCSSYPNGGNGTFRGCGFNFDVNYGVTIADLSMNKLEPLDPSEI